MKMVPRRPVHLFKNGEVQQPTSAENAYGAPLRRPIQLSETFPAWPLMKKRTLNQFVLNVECFVVVFLD